MTKDNYKIIKCPACGENMLKIELPEQKFNIDICLNGCGGIYFDNRELDKVDEQCENINLIKQLIEKSDFKPVDQTKTRFCPICGAKMIKHKSKFNQEVELDDCYTCGGKFLDNGELQKIRKNILYDIESEKTAINNMLIELGEANLINKF